ncbi:MAG: hypothetical protein ACUVV1_01220 [Fimbriimonadales bacterium]
MPHYDEYDDYYDYDGIELPDTEPDWECEVERVFSSGIVRTYCPGEDLYVDIDTEAEIEFNVEDLPAPEEEYEFDRYDDDSW